jgi:DNA polymerase III epsilon subunit-like protein
MFIFIDLETSNLDPLADITEIGCVAIGKDDDKKYKVKPKDIFHKRFLIQNKEMISEEALEVGHYSETIWEKSGVHPKDGLSEWNEWLKKVSPASKPVMCGQNAEFDKSFIFSACDRYNIMPYIGTSWVDLIGLWIVYKDMNGLNHLGNSNAAICEYFKVDNIKAHAALSDSLASAMAMCNLLNLMKFEVLA